MMTNLSISLLDLVTCLAEAVDLVSPSLAHHHQQVAFIAYSLAQELQLTPQEQADLYLAGALHDIGALSLQERITALQFEFEEGSKHERIASDLLQQFPPLQPIARIIRHHHAHWDHGAGEFAPLPVTLSIWRLCRRLLKKDGNISVKDSSFPVSQKQKDKMLHPELLCPLTGRESKFLVRYNLRYRFGSTLQLTILLNLEQLAKLTDLC